MAEPPVTKASPPGGGKKIAGIPTLYLAVGAGAVLLGYLYFKHKGITTGQGQGSGQGGGQQRAAGFSPSSGLTTETLTLWLRDHGGQPRRRPRPRPGPPPRPRPGPGGHHRRKPRVKWPRPKHGKVPV